MSPSGVTGMVVTTSRGLTYAMYPHAGQPSRSRSSPSIAPKVSSVPQREQ